MVDLCKNFVFSSVGDNTNFDSLWINENMNYDVYVIYYGNDDHYYNKYKSKVTFIEKRLGSKFQNFKYFYEKYMDVINKYDRFFILDDDIIFHVEDINNMFNISRKYNLEICGPSFSNKSKISMTMTKHKPNILLSYTNFVEVNTPLFTRTALDKLMEKLDSSLIGWGIDFLYIICNGTEKKKSYAIVHKIVCENPKPENKKEKTWELSKIPDCNNRRKIWEKFAEKNKMPKRLPINVYESIPL